LFEVRQNPDLYRGKLFVLGGVIVSTRATPEGSVIEALYIPVDSQGYLTGEAGGRYLALLPKERGFLDPLIYHEGKKVTIAAEFIQMREDKLVEPGHAFPFFEVKQIYLWEEGVSDHRYPSGFYWRYNPLWWY
jgi:outer membrane lipoprotein